MHPRLYTIPNASAERRFVRAWLRVLTNKQFFCSFQWDWATIWVHSEILARKGTCGRIFDKCFQHWYLIGLVSETRYGVWAEASSGDDLWHVWDRKLHNFFRQFYSYLLNLFWCAQIQIIKSYRLVFFSLFLVRKQGPAKFLGSKFYYLNFAKLARADLIIYI